MSTLTVVEEILCEGKAPMSVREIVERAGSTLPTKSKTPDTVVARDLSMDIKKKGEESIFIRTSPGRYTMRSFVVGGQTDTADTADTATAAAETAVVNQGTESNETANQPTEVLSSSMRNERAGTKSAPRKKDDERESVSL